jgi:glucokinase
MREEPTVIALVADIGGTRIKLALMCDQSVLAQRSLTARSDEGLAPQLTQIVEAFASLCRDAHVDRSACAALAVAFPSLIDPQTGRVLDAYGKYQDAPRLDLARWARETMGLRLLIDNDARLALLGEWQAGAGRGCNDLVMLTLGTGLGTAALTEGRVVRGKHGQAGVMGGHLTVRHGGRLCTCGNRGCAEAEASSSVLRTLAAELSDYSASPLREAEVLDFATVFRLARAGDPCAVSLRLHAIEVWSSLLVNLIHAYDPERVIVGGGVMAGEADFLPELERSVLARAHTPWGRVSIVRSQLGDAAALFGGEFLIRQTLSLN